MVMEARGGARPDYLPRAQSVSVISYVIHNASSPLVPRPVVVSAISRRGKGVRCPSRVLNFFKPQVTVEKVIGIVLSYSCLVESLSSGSGEVVRMMHFRFHGG
jgi:hypothetical protein